MTYLGDLNTYLHQSSLLLQAYPTARITSKYSLPRKSTKPSTDTQKSSQEGQAQPADPTNPGAPSTTTIQREKREPSATLTLKTFHPESGICLKYRTDKAQEVSRLIGGLGRLAKGEIIDMPTTNAGVPSADKMEVDEPEKTEVVGQSSQQQSQQQSQVQTQTQVQGGGGGGGKKKKKGKK